MAIVGRHLIKTTAIPVLKARRVVPLDHREAGTSWLAPLETDLVKAIERGFDRVPDEAYESVIRDREGVTYRNQVYAALSSVEDDITEILLAQVTGTGTMAADDVKNDLLKRYRSIGKADTPSPESLIGAFRFDLDDPRAKAWASAESGRLITNMADEQRAVMRDVVSRSFNANQTRQQMSNALRETLNTISPGTEYGNITSRLIGANVNGLTRQSERAVWNTMNRVADEVAARGITGEKALEQVRRQVDKHADKLRKSRARTIARTELAMAAEEGRQQAWDQAADKGLINRATATKVWSASPMDVCVICGRLQGTKQPMSGSWQTNAGTVKHPPAHPNCRCTMVLVTDPKRQPRTVGTGTPEDPYRLSYDDNVPKPDDFPPLPGSTTPPPPPPTTPPVTPPTPTPPAPSGRALIGMDPSYRPVDADDLARLSGRQRAAGVTVEQMPSVEDAVIQYTNGSGMYSSVNTSLRERDWFDGLRPKKQQEIVDVVSGLDVAIDAAPAIDEKIIVYRGFKREGLKQFDDASIGTVITDEGFMSTSFDRRVAERFAGKDGIVVEIEIRPGTKGLIPNAYRGELPAGQVGEAELILQRGSRIEVLSKRNGQIIARVQPQGEVVPFRMPQVRGVGQPLNPTVLDDLRPAIALTDNESRLIEYGGNLVVEATPSQVGRKAIDATVEAGRRVEARVEEIMKGKGLRSIDTIQSELDEAIATEKVLKSSRRNDLIDAHYRFALKEIDLPVELSDGGDVVYRWAIDLQKQMFDGRLSPDVVIEKLGLPRSVIQAPIGMAKHPMIMPSDLVSGFKRYADGIHSEVLDELERLKDETARVETLVKKLTDERKTLLTTERDAIRQALGEVRTDYGSRRMTVLKIDPKHEASGIGQFIEDASQDLPGSWVESIDLRYKVVKSERGYHSKLGELGLPSGTQGRASATVIHEMTHAAENNVDRLAKINQAFYAESATTGPAAKRKVRTLKSVMPGHGYSADERAIEDEFGDWYAGKWYGGPKGGTHHPIGSFETLTRGVESLLRPDVMSGYFRVSGRYRQFVLGALALL